MSALFDGPLLGVVVDVPNLPGAATRDRGGRALAQQGSRRRTAPVLLWLTVHPVSKSTSHVGRLHLKVSKVAKLFQLGDHTGDGWMEPIQIDVA